MMLRKINRVAKANGLEDRVDIVISVFTLARNGKSNIDFTAENSETPMKKVALGVDVRSGQDISGLEKDLEQMVESVTTQDYKNNELITTRL